MQHDTFDKILKKLQTDLDNITADIDKDNKKKEYLNNSIKELTAKKNDIDKIVGDYEKEFNNITEKNAEFKDYVERKESMTASLGEQKKKEIDKKIEEENKKVVNKENKNISQIQADLTKLLKEDLPNAKINLMKTQSNLKSEQETYEDFKTWLKNYQKELQNKAKKMDVLKTSIDDYIKKSELEELYFFIKESNAFSENLKEYAKEPSKFKSELVGKWKAMNDAMENVHDSEASLMTINYEIEAKNSDLQRLEAERSSKILEDIGKLGTCETDETNETDKTNEAYKS